MSPIRRSRFPKVWVFSLIAFYLCWFYLIDFGAGLEALKERWGIALAMMFGSYVAGSTPMGGGTVGFPILVLLFKQSAELGRDFSFAVQSIGMTSAAIFIIARKQPIEWPIVRWAMLGSLFGTPIGILFIAPIIPALYIKLIFAVLWCSFGIFHLYRCRELAAHEGLAQRAHRFDLRAGLLVGFGAGATVAAITGVGIDVILYAVLVLLYRADLKIAIPSSVIIMAWTSLIGIATKNLTGDLRPDVYENWLAAAPVVALGAPLGAFVVDKIGRLPTLFFVSLLCVGQFIWTITDEWIRLGPVGLATGIFGVLLLTLGLEWIRARGNKMRSSTNRL